MNNAEEYDTPDAFKEYLLSIQNTKYDENFSLKMKNLYLELGCGCPYSTKRSDKTFTGKKTWVFTCAFGGQSKQGKYKTRKLCKCPSYFKLTAEKKDDKILLTFKEANFFHNHSLSPDFFEAYGIISKARKRKIQELTNLGKKPREIRKIEDFSSIPAQNFYDIRRTILRNLTANQITDYLEKSEQILPHFKITHHWRNDTVLKIKKFNGSTFVARIFENSLIAHDIVTLDDTCCINSYDFPLVILSFMDQNNTRQIHSFGIIPGREISHFEMFLTDVKNNIKHNFRVFIVDRWKAQFSAIQRVFPNSQIVFCKIHIERNIKCTMGQYSKCLNLFFQLMSKSISDDVYIQKIDELIAASKKHSLFLQHLKDDLQHYSPTVIKSLRLRNQRTTNVSEGLFGTIKLLDNNADLTLTVLLQNVYQIFMTGVLKSTRASLSNELPSNVCEACNIGKLAQEIISFEYQKAQKIIDDILKGSCISSDKIFNNSCNCIAKEEFGLPCFHTFLERIEIGYNPLIKSNDIPNIYFISDKTQREDDVSAIENIEDNLPTELSFNYSNLMAKFSKIAANAKRNIVIQKHVSDLFEKLNQISIGRDENPDVIQGFGQKVTKPSRLVLCPGARKKKRRYCCSYCHAPNHNIATCHKRRLDIQLRGYDNIIDNNELLVDNDISSSSDYDNDLFQLDDMENRNKEYMKKLTRGQIALLLQCPIMKEFLWQIAEEKNENDKSQFNGIYLVQYPKAVSYCKSICNDSESPKIEAIKFIYELNYGKPIAPELIEPTVQMIDIWIENNAFNEYL